MAIILLMTLGFVCGGVCVWFIFETRRRRVLELQEVLKQQETTQDLREKLLNERAVFVRSNELALTRTAAQFETTKAMFDKNIM